MKKVIKLTETDLTNIVKRVIGENKNDRIIYGSQISNKYNQKLIDDGFTPYYLDLKKVGDYKIVEVKNINRELPKTTFYFLNEREYELLEKLTNNINELSSEYQKIIDLYTI